MNENASYPLVIVSVGSALVVLVAGACTILAVGQPIPTELWAAASALSGALIGILVPAPGSADATKAAVTNRRRSVTEALNERNRTSELLDAAAAARPPALAVERDHRQKAAQTALAAAAVAPPSAAALAAADPPAVAAANALAAHVNAQAAHRAARDELAHVDVQITEAQTRRDQAHARYAELSDAVDGLETHRAAAPGNTHIAAGLVLVVFVVALVIGIHITYQTSGNLVKNATEHDTALTNAADMLIALASAAGGALVGVLAPSPIQTKPPQAGSG